MWILVRALLWVVYCASAVRAGSNSSEERYVREGSVTMKNAMNGTTSSHSYFAVTPAEESCKSQKFAKEFSALKPNVICKPRDTVVDLMADTDTYLIPNVVIVKKCGGTCNGGKRCLSTETRNVTFYVKTKKNGKVSCGSITVQEDTKCKCGCDVKCSDTQVLRTDLCKCTCKGGTRRRTGKNSKRTTKRSRTHHDLYRTCRPNFVWDKNKCSCTCSKNCTTGTRLNEIDCKCVKL